MESEATLWLYSLLFVSTLALIKVVRLPIAWNLAYTAQTLSILALSLAGIVVGPGWLFAFCGWILFFYCYLLPRLILNQFDGALITRDLNQLEWSARFLRVLYWGKAAKFWQDIARAMALYLNNPGGNNSNHERQQAEAILAHLEEEPLPANYQAFLQIYESKGYALLGEWAVIVQEYELAVVTGASLPQSVVIAASRAYAELGELSAAANLLAKCNFPALKLQRKDLAMMLLPFFCMAGARNEAEHLMSSLPKDSRYAPEGLRLYWWARLALAEGKFAECQILMESSKATTTKAMAPVLSRLEAQLERARKEEGSPIQTNHRDIAKVWKIYEDSVYTQSVVAPKGASLAVGSLVALILATYFVTDSYSFYRSDLTGQIKLFAYSNGMLIPAKFFAGEYWRLVTYLFLHGHISHVVLNVLGLYWFGRIAENIFGTGRFFVIYFLSGTLSGVAHSFLDPSMYAIGASGAVMGVFGAVAAGILRLKSVIPPKLRRSELSWLGGLAGAQLILDHIIPHVAAFAHLGGMVAGFFLGLVLKIRPR